MKIDDEILKSSFREYLRNQIPLSRSGCPPFDDIIKLVDRLCPGSRTENLVNHITQCGACSEEFMLLRGIRKQESYLLDGIKSLTNASPKTSERKSGLFSMHMIWKYASILIGVFIIFGLAKHQGDRSVSASYQEISERGAKIVSLVLSKPRRMSTPPFLWAFHWEDSSDSKSYKLEIFDEALFPVLTVPDLKVREYQLPISIAKKFPRNGFWFWTITARSPSGKEFSSPPQRFKLTD